MRWMRLASIRHVTCSMLTLTTDDIHGNTAERHYFTIDKVTRCPIVIYMLLFRQRQQKDQNITKLAPKIFKPAEVMSDLSEY